MQQKMVYMYMVWLPDVSWNPGQTISVSSPSVEPLSCTGSPRVYYVHPNWQETSHTWGWKLAQPWL